MMIDIKAPSGVTLKTTLYAGVQHIEIVIEREFDFAHGRQAEREAEAQWKEILCPLGYTVEAQGHGTDRGTRFIRLFARGPGQYDESAPEYIRDQKWVREMMANSGGGVMNTAIDIRDTIDGILKEQARDCLARAMAILADPTSDEDEYEKAFNLITNARDMAHRLITSKIRHDIQAIRVGK